MAAPWETLLVLINISLAGASPEELKPKLGKTLQKPTYFTEKALEFMCPRYFYIFEGNWNGVKQSGMFAGICLYDLHKLKSFQKE